LARHAAKDEAGFQGLLREAIELPAEDQHNARVKEAIKPADHQECIQSEGQGVELGEGAAKADAAQQGAKDAPPPAANSASEAAEDTAPPLVPAAAAHDGTSDQGEAAAQTALSQLDAQTNLVAMQVAANAPAGQPVVDQTGLLPQAADSSLAVKATLVAPEATAMAAGPAQAAAAQEAPSSQVTGGPANPASLAQTKEALDTTKNTEALTLLAKAVNNTEANALAAGPAQAVAAQVAPGAQVTGGPANPASLARTKEALDTAKNTEALTLLAKAVNNTEANALAAGPAQAAAAQVAPGAQVTGGLAKSVFIAQTKEALDTARNAEALMLLAKAVNNTESAAEVKLVAAAETVVASLRLASLEAPKASSARASSEGRVDSFAMAPPGFAPPDGMLQRTDAPLPSTAAREAPAPPPARQLAPVVVSLALGRGDEALTISLDPGELGRVEVSIGQGKEAGQVRIVAERPETLALLQRDQRDLDRALNQAGLGDMARSMSFSLASDQGRQQQQGSAHERGNRASMIVSGLDGDRAMPSLPMPSRNANSLIDIAV
jgi:Meckel syndrome type 1 protein